MYILGVSGLYDFGPMGCAMKANLVSLWRSHFVLEENMLEIDSTMLTPDPVLRTSGHEKRFSDYIVKDVRTGECFRANKLLENHLEKLASKPKCTPEKIKEYRDIIARVSYVICLFPPPSPSHPFFFFDFSITLNSLI